jgi:hypothetical protein
MGSIGSGQKVAEDHGSGVPQKSRLRQSLSHCFAGLLLAILAVMPLQMCQSSPDLLLTDLWDRPHELHSIVAGQKTLLFICNLTLSTCREGAVYFDSQADKIRANQIQPACIFIGRPVDIRDAVLTMDIQVPVYIDVDGRVFEGLMIQEILPAMVLTDSQGNIAKTLYGGGESLSNNLHLMLGSDRRKSSWWIWFVLIPITVVGVVLIATD